jgi:hypothetical protein
MEDSTKRYLFIGLGVAAIIALGSFVYYKKADSDKPKSDQKPAATPSAPSTQQAPAARTQAEKPSK